jgi:hypothetical protein
MASITWTNVLEFAPELSDVTTNARVDILALVNDLLPVGEWDGESGPKTKMARIYLAAHFGATSLFGGRVVLGETTGAWQQHGDLGSTLYGRMFKTLAKTTPNRVVVL